MPNICINYEKKCGGCPLLALPYREQLAQKQARLQELLGGLAPVKAVQGMAEPLHYQMCIRDRRRGQSCRCRSKRQ